MRIDAMSLGPQLSAVADEVGRAEERGYDGWFTAETTSDPFIIAALAAEHSGSIEVGTAIAVAFSRNPMDVAYSANDCQRLAEGRFVLGLGSQVKPHIQKRFSMEWSQPAARMREFISALRAIWACWNDGADLDVRGEHYQHTLMSPFFAPEPNPYGAPKVYLAAVGPLMTKVAGEAADGILCHSFTTERYLREETLPALREGADAAARSLDDVDVNLGVFVVTGRDDDERAHVDRAIRSQIAFYGSTPAYRKVLDLHGWGDLQDDLHRLSKQGDWAAMADRIDDEMLEAFAVVGEPEEIGARIAERFGDVVDRVSLYTPFEFEGEDWDALRKGVAGV